ncbi:MAG: hypothetical protein ACREPM_02695 [Gemmatimonadaceae bacterium]
MIIAWLKAPWPWYVSGPLMGLFVPVLLLVGNKQLGMSGSLRALCAATVPGPIAPASVGALRVRGTVMHRLLPATQPTTLFLCTAADTRSEPVDAFIRFVLAGIDGSSPE